MSKLLTICPTRGRPKALREMLDSFLQTRSSEDTQMMLYINEDDPCLKEYDSYLDKYPIMAIYGPRRYLAEAYNTIFKSQQEFAYYAPVNDDHVFITPQWDKKLIEIIENKGQGWGLAAAEDHLTNWAQWQHPSGCVLSGNIPRTLGYFVWPKIQHIGIDIYFRQLMQGLGGRLFHTTDVVIEHRHWINGKRLLDENYKFVYSHAQQEYGFRMAAEYGVTQLPLDLAKLRAAML